MENIPGDKYREIGPYLKFLRLLDDSIPLDTRLFHILYNFDKTDFERIVETLKEADITAGFSVPARRLRDYDTIADAISSLADAGHEILVHGDRHTSFQDTQYDVAHDELSRAIETIETVSGVTPTGFHVPFMRVSDGTVDAASDLGIRWLVGAPVGDRTDSLPIITPEHPYDLQLLEQGYSPSETVDCLDEMVTDSSLLLCHPNVHLHHKATEAFSGYLRDADFASPGQLIKGENDAPGLLLDCFAPFSVR